MLAIAITGFDLAHYGASAAIHLDYSFAERLIIASKALWFYIGKLLWPHPLLLHYPHWDVNPLRPLNWLALIAALALVSALWLTRQRAGRAPLCAALFFAICLAPVLGFTDFGYMEYSFAADRYQYLASAAPLAALAAIAVIGIRRLPTSPRHLQQGAMALAILPLTACIALSTPTGTAIPRRGQAIPPCHCHHPGSL